MGKARQCPDGERKNLAARPGQVYFDILVSSDNFRSEKLETSPGVAP